MSADSYLTSIEFIKKQIKEGKHLNANGAFFVTEDGFVIRVSDIAADINACIRGETPTAKPEQASMQAKEDQEENAMMREEITRLRATLATKPDTTADLDARLKAYQTAFNQIDDLMEYRTMTKAQFAEIAENLTRNLSKTGRLSGVTNEKEPE